MLQGCLYQLQSIKGRAALYQLQSIKGVEVQTREQTPRLAAKIDFLPPKSQSIDIQVLRVRVSRDVFRWIDSWMKKNRQA